MKSSLSTVLLIASVACAGCLPTPAEPIADGIGAAATTYLATSEPADAVPVGIARKESENGQEITLLGRIGGSSEPFIDGLAAFTIVDPNVPYCADDEGCPTPWDYCCETDAVKSNIATVKIVDTSGKPIQQSAKSLIPLKELSVIVVKGKAKRDDQGNLSISATQVFVRPGE
ncbi:MAG: hypothetical protein RL240_1135 [Planctomycetota bacterium]|jgi:hypothetical protein